MKEPVVCEGAPRDQGLDQGLACAAAIRDRIARAGLAGRRRIPSLRPLASGRVLGSGVGRKVLRHHPHLAERIAGIARGANLSFDSLMELFCSEVGLESGASVAVAAAAEAAERGDPYGTLALCWSPIRAVSAASWIARCSRPEVGYASLELTLPWHGTAIAGVNEAGIAVAFVSPEALVGERSQQHDGVPPVVLVQDCLQRFADLDSCVEWCVKRPTGGHGSIVMADAVGGLAGLRFEGASRCVVSASDGLLVEGGSRALRAAIRDAGKADATGTAATLLAPSAAANGEALASVLPAEHQLLCPERGSAFAL